MGIKGPNGLLAAAGFARTESEYTEYQIGFVLGLNF
jgi:hypothetical protein